MLTLLIILGFIASFFAGKFWEKWQNEKIMEHIFLKNPALIIPFKKALASSFNDILERRLKRKVKKEL